MWNIFARAYAHVILFQCVDEHYRCKCLCACASRVFIMQVCVCVCMCMHEPLASPASRVQGAAYEGGARVVQSAAYEGGARVVLASLDDVLLPLLPSSRKYLLLPPKQCVHLGCKVATPFTILVAIFAAHRQAPLTNISVKFICVNVLTCSIFCNNSGGHIRGASPSAA